MDTFCIKPPIIAAVPCHVTSAVEKATSATPPLIKRTVPWGFSFKYPLRSLWKRYDAVALDIVEEREPKEERKAKEERDDNWVSKIMHVRSVWGGERENEGEPNEEVEAKEGREGEERDENWVSKILHVRSVWGGEREEDRGDEDDDVCVVYDDENGDEKVEFDRKAFSRFLKRVSLAEARMYARMSYLGNLAYCIPLIKPKNLLRVHGLRFVTSSIEKKEKAIAAEKEKEPTLAEVEKQELTSKEHEENREQETSFSSKISPSAAYHIAASAASYLHTQTKSIISFRSSKSDSGEENCEKNLNDNLTHDEVASLMATTDSMTAVVAAKEEVKQAVADDLNSTLSSPCGWYICDDDLSGTRYFVIQGSESMASWQANLLFEPIQFEGLDVPVHRGIYEAAKGLYEQMLPEVHAHLKSHGDRATFRFTGHSLGGSLSLLINLMLLKRGEVPLSSLLPVITFGSPSIMCGGDRLLQEFGLPRHHVQSINMHRDIVPRAFSCNYPSHVAEFLKAINGNFRNHPCLNNQKLLYAPMGEFLILQPDEKHSPNHDLLPPGSGLYLLNCPTADLSEADKQLRAAKSLFLNSPHPLEILSDRSAYGSDGTVQRDHDMGSYLKSVRSVIRQELNQIRRAKREQRRKIWWPLVGSSTYGEGIVVNRPVSSNDKFTFSGILQTGTKSLKRFSRLVASQDMHLLVVLLIPARLIVLGTFGVIKLIY